MATFGKTGVGGSQDNDNNNCEYISRFVLSENGTITGLSLYLDNLASGHAACYAKSALYADSSGVAGALLATGTAVAIANSQALGWVWLPFTSGVAEVAGTYHLGWMLDANGKGVDTYYDTGTYAAWLNRTYTLGFIDPFGTPTNSGARSYSVYATYTVPADMTPLIFCGRC